VGEIGSYRLGGAVGVGEQEMGTHIFHFTSLFAINDSEMRSVYEHVTKPWIMIIIMLCIKRTNLITVFKQIVEYFIKILIIMTLFVQLFVVIFRLILQKHNL
jgi:hypothetical protein